LIATLFPVQAEAQPAKVIFPNDRMHRLLNFTTQPQKSPISLKRPITARPAALQQLLPCSPSERHQSTMG
jgi:hypothetical protein